MAPFGGADARVATNPFSIAVPTGNDFPSAVLSDGAPMSLDFATSIVANGKLQVAANKDEDVAEGLVIDEHGQSSSNPRYPAGWSAEHPPPKRPDGNRGEMSGAILPFGMHKGSGIGIMCEMLAGALGGGFTVRDGGVAERSSQEEPQPRGR